MVRGEEWFFFLSMQRLQTLFFSSPSSVFVYSCFPSFSLFGLCFSSSLVSSFVLKQIIPFCFSTLLSKISTTPLYFSLLQNLLFVSVFFFKSLSSQNPLFLVLGSQKPIPFFSFVPPFSGSPPVFIEGRGRRSPCPTQAQGKVVGAWLAILFHYGGRVREVWVVLGFGQVGRKRENAGKISIFYI